MAGLATQIMLNLRTFGDVAKPEQLSNLIPSFGAFPVRNRV
jgi:hypothetical protein